MIQENPSTSLKYWISRCYWPEFLASLITRSWSKVRQEIQARLYWGPGYSLGRDRGGGRTSNRLPCLLTRCFPVGGKLVPYLRLRVVFFPVQFSSVQSLSCVWLFVTPWTAARQASLSIHQLLVFTQTHVHQVSDAIQPSHPLSSPSPPALNLSQHQSPFQWVSSLHQVAKVLEFQFQHQSFQWTPRTDLL